MDAANAPGRHARQRHRDQPAGEPAEGAAGAGALRRRGPRGDATRRSSTPRPRSGPAASAASRRRPRASPGRGSCVQEGVIGAGRARRLHPDRPPAQGPDATVAYHTADQKTFDDVLGKRGVKRAALRQPGGAGAERPGRDRQGDRGVRLELGADMMKTHIAINGAGGRMGQRLVALAKEDPELAGRRRRRLRRPARHRGATPARSPGSGTAASRSPRNCRSTHSRTA